MNKNKIRIITIIVIIILIVISIIFMITKVFTSSTKISNKDSGNNVVKEIDSKWKSISEIEKYEYDVLKPNNLNEIEVSLGKINFEYDNGKKITYDYSNYSDKLLINDKIKYSGKNINLDDIKKRDPGSSIEYFQDINPNILKVEYYRCSTDNSCQVIVDVDGIKLTFSYDNSSKKSEQEFAEDIKNNLLIIKEYDKNAPTLSEYLDSLIRKTTFNIPFINLDEFDISSAITFDKASTNNSSSKLYISDIICNNGPSADFTTASYNNVNIRISGNSNRFTGKEDNYKVKEYKINNNLIRIYRKEWRYCYKYPSEEDKLNSYDYYFGIVYNNKEYLFYVGNNYECSENGAKLLFEENDLTTAISKLIEKK